MAFLLDASVLIGSEQLPAGAKLAISAISISELHFGVHRAPDEEKRLRRVDRLGFIESRFPNPLPVDDRVARAWGQMKAAVAQRGANPRARMADLGIAATARIYGVTLLTYNVKDFALIEDLVDVRSPA